MASPKDTAVPLLDSRESRLKSRPLAPPLLRSNWGVAPLPCHLMSLDPVFCSHGLPYVPAVAAFKDAWTLKDMALAWHGAIAVGSPSGSGSSVQRSSPRFGLGVHVFLRCAGRARQRGSSSRCAGATTFRSRSCCWRSKRISRKGVTPQEATGGGGVAAGEEWCVFAVYADAGRGSPRRGIFPGAGLLMGRHNRLVLAQVSVSVKGYGAGTFRYCIRPACAWARAASRPVFYALHYSLHFGYIV